MKAYYVDKDKKEHLINRHLPDSIKIEVKKIIKEMGVEHYHTFCKAKGKQYRRCCVCITEDILKRLEEG